MFRIRAISAGIHTIKQKAETNITTSVIITT